jgi:ABC-2 type transport system permease protein
MTSLTIAAHPSNRPAVRPGRGVALGRTIRSEFTKIRSVRSTYWTLFVLVLASVAWCVTYCLGTVHQWPAMSAQARIGFDATQSAILGLAFLGQLVIVVLGALMLTSEHSTGMVRTSLTVMPRRRTLYAAKAAVFAAVSLVVSFVTSFGTFFLGRVLLSSTHVPVSLSQPGVLRSLIVTALYVEVCGLFAFGIGALVRNTAGAITIAFGCLALLPQLLRALPGFLHNDLMRWLPGGDAINVMTATKGGQLPHMFSAWGELATFAGYAVILLVAGAVAFCRRDETQAATELLAAAPGGVGYLLKDRVADVSDFIDAITRVAHGGTVLDPEVVRQLLTASRRGDTLAALTPREREVLSLIAQGRSNAAIAGTLFISPKVVEKHVANIFDKLGLAPDDNDNRRVIAAVRYLES